jgi:hypothetical protein
VTGRNSPAQNRRAPRRSAPVNIQVPASESQPAQGVSFTNMTYVKIIRVTHAKRRRVLVTVTETARSNFGPKDINGLPVQSGAVGGNPPFGRWCSERKPALCPAAGGVTWGADGNA